MKRTMNITRHFTYSRLAAACLCAAAVLSIPVASATAQNSATKAPTKLFVVNVADSSISLVDIHTLKELNRFKVGAHPYFCAVSGDQKTLAVSVEGESKIKFYDTKTLKQKGEIPFNKMNSDHMILLPDGVHVIMAAREDNAIAFINLNTMKEDYRIQGVSSPHNIRIGKSGRYAYASSKLNPGINVIDLQEHRQKHFFSTRFIPRGLAISDDEKTIFTGANWVSGVFEMDAETGKIKRVDEIPLPGNNPTIDESTYHGLEVMNDHILLGTNEGFSSFDIIDLRTGKLVNRTTDVSNPGALLQLPGTENRFVMTNMGDNTVEVIQIDNEKDIKVLSKTKIGVDTAEFPKRFAFYYE